MSLPPERTRACFVAGLWLALVLATSTLGADFQYIRLESGGARYGVAANLGSGDFRQADLILKWGLPFDCYLGRNWHMHPRLETSGGWLFNDSDDAAIGSLGPAFEFTHGTMPLSLEGGLSTTIISRWDFEERDFGSPLQFTTHIGINAELSRHFRLTYRFQHMSNGGLTKPNPGLNLHMAGLCYIF